MNRYPLFHYIIITVFYYYYYYFKMNEINRILVQVQCREVCRYRLLKSRIRRSLEINWCRVGGNLDLLLLFLGILLQGQNHQLELFYYR